MQETSEDKAVESDGEGSNSVLQYAGVLKKFFQPAKDRAMAIKAPATSSDTQPPATLLQRLGSKGPTAPVGQRTESPSVIAKRLGRHTLLATEAQDSHVTSSRSKADSGLRVTVQRPLGSAKVSSTTETPSAQMDNPGTVSVFKRLGKKQM